MAILTEYPLWLLIICVLLGVAYSLLLYYKNRSIEFPKTSKKIMAICRGTVIAVIAFLLLSPMVKLNLKQVEKPILVVAVDNSESIMSTKDSAFYLNKYNEEISRLLKAFGDDYDVKPYFIGDKDSLFNTGDQAFTPDFHDKSTNLSSIFDYVSTIYDNRNVGAMILLSDGIYNTGANPYYQAEKLKFPVYTVGLGDPELQKDLLIAGIRHNRQTFKGNFSPVEINIKATKLAGQSATLTVHDGQREIFNKKISISGTQYFETVKLSIDAKEKGIHKYIVTLTHLDGEITYKNNAASFFIEVVDSREKIAIIYNSPHPDISAINQALATSDKYQVELFQADEFTKNSDEYSLLVLHQLPSVTNAMQNLFAQVKKNGVSVLYILGSQSNIANFNTQNGGLNITVRRNLFNDATPAYNDNFTSFTFSEEAKKMLRNYPPLRTFFGEYKIANSANVFIHQKVNNVTTNYPLIVFNDIAGIKTGVITGEGLWQWRIYNYLYAKNHDCFNELINKLALYLSVKEDKSFFRVHSKLVFDENAPVEFDAELYNDSYELISDPDVSMIINSKDGKKYTSQFSKQNNAYYLNVGKLPVGDYSWQASVKNGNRSYNKTGFFSVKEVLLESANLVADHVLLQDIAKISNGKFFTVDHLQDVEKEIKNNDTIKPIATYTKKYSLFLNSPWYLVLILLLLATEWFLRKWGGGY